MFQSIWNCMPLHGQTSKKAIPSVGRQCADNALFGALICEIHWTALQIGGVTQLFNAAAHDKLMSILSRSRDLLPGISPVIALAIKSRDRVALSQAAAQRVATAYFHLEDAKCQTEDLLNSLTKAEHSKLIELKIQQLTATWSNLALDFLGLAGELQPGVCRQLPHVHSQNLQILGPFLANAAKGGRSHVDSRGRLTLPALPQRRREQRFVMLQPCHVTKQSGQTTGMARDVSRGGMRLACPGAFVLHEPVTVHLRIGRRFLGRVVWAKGDQQGIQFNEPLSYADPLIAI